MIYRDQSRGEFGRRELARQVGAMRARHRRSAIIADTADACCRGTPQWLRKSDVPQGAAHGAAFGIALMLWSCAGGEAPSLLGADTPPPRANSFLPTPPPP